MKNILKGVAIVAVISVAIIGAVKMYDLTQHYERYATVESVENGVVTFLDTKYNTWEWEMEEGESFRKGQKVVLKMSENWTESFIEDDIIEAVEHKMWFEW